MVEFGIRFKQLRLQNKLTQEQVAQKLDVTKSVISAYETGIRMPSYYVLLAISRMFKVSTDYLLGNTNNNIEFVDLSGLTHDEKVSIKNLVNTMRKG